MIDVNKLKELAQAATPGPWQVGNKIARFVYANDDTPICECDSIGEAANREAATAAFIAAANPAIVLELIDTQRELVEALKALFKVASENLPLAECEEYEQTLAAIRHATGEYRE